MKRRELLFGRACVGEPHEHEAPWWLVVPHEAAAAPPLAHRPVDAPGGDVPAPPRCRRVACSSAQLGCGWLLM